MAGVLKLGQGPFRIWGPLGGENIGITPLWGYDPGLRLGFDRYVWMHTGLGRRF